MTIILPPPMTDGGMSLEMSTVPIGAFDDERVSATLDLAEDETPIYIMPAGSR